MAEPRIILDVGITAENQVKALEEKFADELAGKFRGLCKRDCDVVYESIEYERKKEIGTWEERMSLRDRVGVVRDWLVDNHRWK